MIMVGGHSERNFQVVSGCISKEDSSVRSDLELD
jgi:hypothetical protein